MVEVILRLYSTSPNSSTRRNVLRVVTSDFLLILSFFMNVSGIQVFGILLVSNTPLEKLELARRLSLHLCLIYMFAVKSCTNGNKIYGVRLTYW